MENESVDLKSFFLKLFKSNTSLITIRGKRKSQILIMDRMLLSDYVKEQEEIISRNYLYENY